MSGSKAQKGFTLIEVSLAIVIGVIVLAGAITLYNQTKMSAGNSKAAEKSLALASLVEEMGASNNGIYPLAAGLATAWTSRRDDARTSPWGGQLGGAGQPILMAPPYVWATGYAAGPTAGYHIAGTSNGGISTDVASGGQMIYVTGLGTASVWDVNSIAVRTYTSYLVGMGNSVGVFAAFTAGGK